MDTLDDAPDMSSISFELLLPSPQDEIDIRKNMSVLVACILKKYMPFFEKYGHGIERHIMHQYSEEMSRKSSVVSIHFISSFFFMHNALSGGGI